MLNILKRKLVNSFIIRSLKLILYFLIFYFVFINVCFSSYIKQGDVIDFDYFSDIRIGIKKADVLKKFGVPSIFINDDFEFLGYYYYYYPSAINGRVVIKYIGMFFENSILISYFFRF